MLTVLAKRTGVDASGTRRGEGFLLMLHIFITRPHANFPHIEKCKVEVSHHIDQEEGLAITFQSLGNNPTERETLRKASALIEKYGLYWLRPNREVWELDSSSLQNWLAGETVLPDHTASYPKGRYKSLLGEIHSWLVGRVGLRPVIKHLDSVTFTIFKEDYLVDRHNRIFLSHKGADKPIVERFYSVLLDLGFNPWLDKEDLHAGKELHRGIQQGFKESCAAVFFITPNFKDEKYLRNEINYAIQQKTEKGERFEIITLVFTDKIGKQGVVPEALREAGYVWKTPSSEIDGLRDILRALPLRVGPIGWRQLP